MKRLRKLMMMLAVLTLSASFLTSCNYNDLTEKEQKVEQQWAQVQNVYQRRADLIPNLVSTVKGYAAHESQTLEAVVNARAKATQITVDPSTLDEEQIKKFQQAQGELSSALGRLMAVTEAYPDLKANENFLSLQDQLEGTENRIAVERKRYTEAVMDYNTFAQKEAAEHDFKEVQNYAINEFFEKNITKAEQPIIAAAYQRIERNVASPQDIMLIKRYFTDAKNAYRSQQGNKPGGNTGRSNRLKQGKAFPRSSDIDGAGTDTGSVTNDTLAKMLEEKPFSEIPPEYQKMLLGY